MTSYNPRGGYENRSMLNEAIANRVVREFELESIYKGSERAAVEIMHKYDGTRQEMAWVLQGDSFTKSTAVFEYIDSIIKNQPGQPWNASANRDPLLSQRNRGNAMGMLPGFQEDSRPFANDGSSQLSGGASRGTAGGNQQSHPAPPPAKPGLGQRLKTWASERAAPAMRRGLQHAGAGLVGGLAGGPLGVLAGVGASMYGNRNLPKQPVFGGEGGLGQIAGDAARQGGQAVAGAAQQQAQNYQTGQGAMGKVGQAAGTAGNLAGSAWQGLKNMGQRAAQGVQNAWQQAGAAQQQNADALREANLPPYLQPQPRQEAAQVSLPDASTQHGGINTALSPQGPGTAPPVPLPGADPNAAPAQPQTAQPQTAQVDPAQAAAAVGGGDGSTFAQNAGMFNTVRTSNDTFTAINAILKGW